jgi:hypothetical protein
LARNPFGRPPPRAARWAVTAFWLRWLIEGVGWIITALGAAAITGLIRHD